MYPTVLWSILLLCSSGVHATALQADLVNELRLAAGMTTLTENALLAQAADNHAEYLEQNFVENNRTQGFAHLEQTSAPHFTGENLGARALSAGYAHQLVYENISVGNQDIQASVVDLMSAIYHRFTFLDFAVSEMGVAAVGNNYVYELGRAPLRAVCENPSIDHLSRPSVQCNKQAMRYQPLYKAV